MQVDAHNEVLPSADLDYYQPPLVEQLSPLILLDADEDLARRQDG